MADERFPFRARHRLSGKLAFAAVFDADTAKTVGPLRVFTRPNGLAHCRLGLTVSRRVGHAVKRHRIKRLLREAFRLMHATWPGAYDVVVVVRPHEARTLADYRRLLGDAVRAMDLQWRKRDGTHAD